MAKRQAATSAIPAMTTMQDLREYNTTLLGKALHNLQTQFGDPMIGLAADAGFSSIGIPLPSLAMEYLIMTTVWPVNGRLSMLVGETMAGKTMFLTEIMRWNYWHCAGHNWLIETEYSKHSYDLPLSIMGWEHSEGLAYVPAPTMNDWQERTQSALQTERILMDGPDGYSMVRGISEAQAAGRKKPAKYANKNRRVTRRSEVNNTNSPASGRRWPVILGIDAIMSVSMAETCAKIEQVGFADRSHPLEAMSITGFLRKLPQDMYGYPFHVIGINHKKFKPLQAGQMHQERYKPGGSHIDFAESIELELTKRSLLRTADYEGQLVNIKCYKNCLGTRERSINVEIKWWTEQVEHAGVTALRQRTVFDWYAASINLLLEQMPQFPRLRSIIDLTAHQKPGVGTLISSSALGIPASDPVSRTQAGHMLQHDPASAPVLEAVRDVLGIKRLPGFRPGYDFREQVEAAKREMRTSEVRQKWVNPDGSLDK